jgi:hypothetical protein
LKLTVDEKIELRWLAERQLKELENGNWLSNNKIMANFLNGKRLKRCDILRSILDKINETF